MGRNKIEESNHNRTKATSDRSVGSSPAYVAFWPTKAERELISKDETPAEELVSRLAAAIDRGVTFKLATTKEGTSYSVTLQDANAGYMEGTAIGVFHSNLLKALRAAVYCLETKWPDYPDVAPRPVQRELDW